MSNRQRRKAKARREIVRLWTLDGSSLLNRGKRRARIVDLHVHLRKLPPVWY